MRCVAIIQVINVIRRRCGVSVISVMLRLTYLLTYLLRYAHVDVDMLSSERCHGTTAIFIYSLLCLVINSSPAS